MRHVLLVVAWLMFITGIFSLLFPQYARDWGNNLASLVGAGPEPVALVVGEKTGYSRDLADAMANDLSEAGFTVNILEASSPADAATFLAQGEAQLALLPGGEIADAEVLHLAQFKRAYVHVLVPQMQEANAFGDLVDSRVGVAGAYPGAEKLVARLFRELGLGNTSLPHQPVALQPDRMASALLQGRVDCLIGIFPLMAPEITSLLQSGYYRLIPMPESAAFSRLIPGLENDMLPENLYGPGRVLPSEPLPATVVPLHLMTHPDTDPTALAALLNLMDSPAWKGTHPQTQLASTASFDGLPPHPLLHEGAYRSEGTAETPSLIWLALTLAALAVLLWQYYTEYQMRQRRTLASQVRGIIESDQRNLSEEGPGILIELARQMMDGQNRAMQHWLSGRYSTQQLQLLMALYLSRSQQLLARYSMIPKGTQTPVDPQRRPWQAPEKTGIQRPLPATKDAPVDLPPSPLTPPSPRPSKPASSHTPLEVNPGNASREKDTRPKAAPQRKTHHSDAPLPPGEDITHEVLPADYDGDIIAVRKRPRSNPEKTEAPKESTTSDVTANDRPGASEANGHKSESSHSDKKREEQPAPKDSASASSDKQPHNTPTSPASKPTAPSSSPKKQIASNPAPPKDHTPDPKAPSSHESTRANEAQTPNKPPRKRRKKRRLNKEDQDNKDRDKKTDEDAPRQSIESQNTAANKRVQQGNQSSETTSSNKVKNRPASDKKKTTKGSEDDQMMLF